MISDKISWTVMYSGSGATYLVGGHMAIPFEKLKAHPPANPKIGAEHDALAPEFEIAVELRRARLSAGLLQAELAARMGSSQSTIARSKAPNVTEHEGAPALRRDTRQQVSRAVVGGLMRHLRVTRDEIAQNREVSK